MHSIESLVGPVDEWHESCLPLGGEGCPEVAEFAVTEFAAALGRSTESGRRYLSHAVEGHYRLRGLLGPARGRRAAGVAAGVHRRPHHVPATGGRGVRGRHGRPVRAHHRPGPAGPVDRGSQSPVRPRGHRGRTASRRGGRALRHRPGQVGVDGRVRVDGDLDLADALDLEAAIAADAHHQLLLGSTESLDVRRAIAAGNLARHQPTLDLDRHRPRHRARTASSARAASVRWCSTCTSPKPRWLGAGGLARVQETRGPVTAAQVREWCAQPDAQITVQPVLDLAEHLHITAYEASARLKLQTQLRDVICAFAFCFRPAEDCDCEHRVPHEGRGGPTCSCNQAPCCRRHHRAKTTGGWTYVTVEPGVYLWRSPLGYQFLKDHTGTLDVTPNAERLRLAHEFRNHFGPTAPPTPNPDHPAPHPAQHKPSGEFGAL